VNFRYRLHQFHNIKFQRGPHRLRENHGTQEKQTQGDQLSDGAQTHPAPPRFLVCQKFKTRRDSLTADRAFAGQGAGALTVQLDTLA